MTVLLLDPGYEAVVLRMIKDLVFCLGEAYFDEPS